MESSDQIPQASRPHDSQTTLQTEFVLLKKATSKNIEQFQDTINLQETYTTSLCSHVNTIYAKLVQLENQIQAHCLYPNSQVDSVQINTPEYDSDRDGQTKTLLDLQSHAENNQEDPNPATGDSKDPERPQDTNRTNPQPESVQNPSLNNIKIDKDPN